MYFQVHYTAFLSSTQRQERLALFGAKKYVKEKKLSNITDIWIWIFTERDIYSYTNHIKHTCIPQLHNRNHPICWMRLDLLSNMNEN
jgi:hypothetical protein